MPSVGSDLETIILELHPSIVAHDPNKDAKYNIISTNADGDTVSFEVTRPTFARQEILAKVVIRTGETVVLGGLINEEDTTEVTKVPLLGDIPGLGALFRRTVKNKTRSNLLIFVTAEIVDTRGRFYHPDGTEAKSANGRDILPDIMPTMQPANGGANGSQPAATADPSVSQKPADGGREGAEWTPRDGDKDRATIKIERPKPARIGRKK
jgi:type IV pilus assembly protein PilQ